MPPHLACSGLASTEVRCRCCVIAENGRGFSDGAEGAVQGRERMTASDTLQTASFAGNVKGWVGWLFPLSRVLSRFAADAMISVMSAVNLRRGNARRSRLRFGPVVCLFTTRGGRVCRTANGSSVSQLMKPLCSGGRTPPRVALAPFPKTLSPKNSTCRSDTTAGRPAYHPR